ncbi:MAG: hypothetical protein NZ550_03160 [Fimbriimonadales bacterium]|nr:hypothetical protein [Fimbriimonadales bacterium]MDW8052491.1 hypothetical protein [Armatimonadota bacterium]
MGCTVFLKCIQHRWWALGVLLLLRTADAQQPLAFFGARLQVQARADERTTSLRWYDDLARHSVVFLQLHHESGYGAYIAQRLQNLATDRTRTALDEAYLERMGGWRVGKFYATFGAGLLLNESVIAVQSPTRFAIGDLPMRVAYLFNGRERQRGVYVRVGTERGGISVGVGNRFGIDPHAFAIWELPERPRSSEGYETLYGSDYRLSLGGMQVQLEWLYSAGKRVIDTHWFALRAEFSELPLQPELRLAYQTHAQRLSWRIAVGQRLDDRTRLSFVLRGQEGRILLGAVGVQGDL